MVMTLRQSNKPPNGKGKTGEEQSQEHVHNYLWHQEFVKVNSAHYSDCVGMCEDFTPRATKELAVAL
jgi:hypothetical protein